MTVRVAAIQMVSTADVEANLQMAQQLLQQAADKGAQFAALPETFAVFDSNSSCRWGDEEQRTGLFTRFIAEQAQALNLWILAGTLPLRTRANGEPVPDNRVRAASILFNPQGEQAARYDKLHLFDVRVKDAQGQYRESATIEPGDQPVVTDTPWGRLGMTVCYDLRFPELYRYLQQQGAGFFTVPSAFTQRTGEAHWEVLLRARAIETQCYVIAPNQGGVHSEKRTTWGRSMIIDPWGRVLDCVETGPGIALADMDPSLLDSIRASMPVIDHKRFRTEFSA